MHAMITNTHTIDGNDTLMVPVENRFLVLPTLNSHAIRYSLINVINKYLSTFTLYKKLQSCVRV